MLRKVEYHPEAKFEMSESANWYDKKVNGLGLEFLLEVRNAESKIVENPEQWSIYEAGTRRYLMRTFPFAIIYISSKEKIQVVAIGHSKRKPGFWKERLKRK